MIMAPKARATPFLRDHQLAYAVKPSQYYQDQPSVVLSAECLFCVYHGREEQIGSKRRKTGNVKYFTAPFRTDNYLQHHRNQHSTLWENYQSLSSEDKKLFFADVIPVKETMHQYFSGKQVEKIYLINAGIVTIIIGEMLWDPEDFEGETHSKMLSAFVDCRDVTENLESDEVGNDRFMVVIKNQVQFNLAVDYVSVGCSFRQASRLLLATKERTGLAAIGSCTDLHVAKYVRYICAINLQMLSELMMKCWTFSIALDMSTHMSRSYLDIRGRFHIISRGIGNFHFIGIPIYDRHTAEVIFNSTKKFLDVLCPSWENIIVGITTDGEKKMTGRVSGVSTRFQSIANPGFIRVWCAAHQLDLVLQDVYSNLAKESFYSELTNLISYLRRQQNLISDMRSKAPKIADTRWESMSSVSEWFRLHRIAVLEYLNAKTPSCSPSSQWWILISAIESFSRRCSITFRQLQGHKVTISQQRQHLACLVSDLLSDVGGKGPLADADIDEYSDIPSMWLLSTCRKFAVNLQEVVNFVHDMGSFVSDRVDELEENLFATMVRDIGGLYVNAISSIATISAERDENNNAFDNALPACLPQDLVKLPSREFCAIVRLHKLRLQQRWSASDIDLIEQQHRNLVTAYSNESVLKEALDSLPEFASFEESWKVITGRFKQLEKFCGGLATVFPVTAQVESDFSVLKSEKDDFRTSITDLSLEGIMHSKQFDALKKFQAPL